MKKTAVFRADGATHIGLGHLMRCSVLAEELINRGWDCSFITRAYDESLLHLLGSKGMHFVMLEPHITLHEDLKFTQEYVTRANADVVVTDSYSFDAEYLSGIACLQVRSLNIDDCAQVHQYADLVLNQNAGAEDIEYQSENHTEFLLGPRYALLRREFRDACKKLRPVSNQARHVLVTLGGGADEANVTGKILEAVLHVEGLTADIVVSKANQHLQSLRNLCRTSGDRFVMHEGTDRMAELMLRADLIVSAGGTTCWEKCCLGLPGFTVILSDNQINNARCLEKHGATINLGWGHTLSVAKFREQFQELANDMQRRQGMRDKARELVDGCGVLRVVDRLEEIVSRR